MTTFQKFMLAWGLLFLISCQPNEKVIEKIIEKPIPNESNEKLIKIDSAMTDEELTEAGEQLLFFPTVPLAEKAFQMALLKNPENLKAQFYTEGFLKNYTIYKGFLTRIKPLVAAQGESKSLEKIINELPSVPMRKYLLEGKEDIATISDLQNFIFEMQTNTNSFRKWLIKNYDKSLTINLDPVWLFINAGSEGKHACEIIDETEGKAKCNYNNIFSKKLGPPDLMALRQMISGYVIFQNFYTAYNFEGLDKIAKIDPNDKLSPEKKWAYLDSLAPKALILQEKNMLKETMEIGSDLVNAIKYAQEFREKLCPKGNGSTRQRVGFLFQDGICVESNDKGLRNLELALAGIPIKHEIKYQHFDELGNKKDIVKEFKTNLFTWFKTPVTNLRSIGPREFDECGQVKSLKDKTFGGFFVDGNAEEILLSEKKSCSVLKNKGT